MMPCRQYSGLKRPNWPMSDIKSQSALQIDNNSVAVLTCEVSLTGPWYPRFPSRTYGWDDMHVSGESGAP